MTKDRCVKRTLHKDQSGLFWYRDAKQLYFYLVIKEGDGYESDGSGKGNNWCFLFHCNGMCVLLFGSGTGRSGP